MHLNELAFANVAVGLDALLKVYQPKWTEMQAHAAACAASGHQDMLSQAVSEARHMKDDRGRMSHARVFCLGKLFQEAALARNRFPAWRFLRSPYPICWFEGAPFSVPGSDREPIVGVLIEVDSGESSNIQAMATSKVRIRKDVPAARAALLALGHPAHRLSNEEVVEEFLRLEHAITTGTRYHPGKPLEPAVRALHVTLFFRAPKSKSKTLHLPVPVFESYWAWSTASAATLDEQPKSNNKLSSTILMIGYNLISLITSSNVRVIKTPVLARKKKNKKKDPGCIPETFTVKIIPGPREVKQTTSGTEGWHFTYRHWVRGHFKRYHHCQTCKSINGYQSVLARATCRGCGTSLSNPTIEHRWCPPFQRGPDVGETVRKVYETEN